MLKRKAIYLIQSKLTNIQHSEFWTKKVCLPQFVPLTFVSWVYAFLAGIERVSSQFARLRD